MSFQHATEAVERAQGRLSNDQKLTFYGYFKQATVGDAPARNPCGPFDMKGSAKYGAWNKCRGMSKDAAQAAYIAAAGALL